MSKQASSDLSKEDIAALRDLAPGSVVDVQVDTPVSPQRLKTSYIGMDINQAFIFEVPNTHKWANIREYLLAGSDVVVRFIIEGGYGEVIAFKVQILKYYSKPVSMLVTSFPKRIQKQGLRSGRRSHPGIPVSVGSESDELEQQRGLIIDVSQSGCKLAVKMHSDDTGLKINTKITLGCKLDGETIRIGSTVKNVIEVKGYYYYGIQFTSEQLAVNTLLDRYTLAM